MEKHRIIFFISLLLIYSIVIFSIYSFDLSKINEYQENKSLFERINQSYYESNGSDVVIDGTRYRIINGSIYTITEGGSNILQKVGVGDSVSVTITRNRWYGKIIGNGNDEMLYLFQLIPIPQKIRGVNYMPIHFLAILTILFLSFAINIKEVTK